MEEYTIIDRLEEYTKRDPHAAILFDEAHSKGITYDRLDDISARIYGWLKQKGIGREDFVLIDMPRGVLPVIAMIGVWKAGAAWVLVEDTYAPDRIDYIRKDCGCKIDIDMNVWEEILVCEPKAGHENVDIHDAAYAVYTSGTTGNPKGVLHEYGNLERCMQSIRIDGKYPVNEKDRIANLAPMNFVASVALTLLSLTIFGLRMYIVSYSTTKNKVALARFFLTNRITVTFLSPSYVRMLGGKTGPFLRMILVGSEPANNLYLDNIELLNVYASSESGYAIGVFKIDREYDQCPIGKPQVETKIMLLKEDGSEAADGEMGELCFEDPYVRGYINLPEENKKSFVDGIFHSGDLAVRGEDGNYILLGRIGDMIKINGNRIEPAEIEAAVKEVLGIDWVAARGFTDNGKSLLCAYYTADIEPDADYIRQELMKRLPYYMIPAYYIKIDEVPLKPNGKMDRKALPKPEVTDYRNDYVAPENDIQDALCKGFESVLDLERVGIHDDFYEMGGDSLSSIELITKCNIEGLTSTHIFRGRTPEKIAQLYELSKGADGSADDFARVNDEAQKESWPLTAEQLYMVDYQLYTPDSTMYNLFSMMKFDLEIYDMERLTTVMKECIAHYPALLTMYFWNDDGELMQRYDPELADDLRVEHLTEFEFSFVKDMMVYPYKIIGGRLHRCRVFETEKAGYIFFSVHHSVFDGTSMKVFMDCVQKAYMGLPLDKDYYYLMLKRRHDAIGSEYYEECREYFENLYDNTKWSSYPRTDHKSRDNRLGELIVDMGIEQPQMKAMEKNYRISRNEFFITVAALAISIYNNENDIKVCWNYNGREDLELMNTVGLLFRELPVGIHFYDDLSLRDVFADIRGQVQKGIEHCIYPYVDLHGRVAEDEAAYVLYQQDIRDMGDVEDAGIEMVDIRQNQAASQTILDMEILDGSGGLQLMIDFAASWYDEESIVRFKDIYIKLAQAMVTHHGQKDLTVKELKDKVSDRKNFFSIALSAIGRKR